jgi:hypothetical protein
VEDHAVGQDQNAKRKGQVGKAHMRVEEHIVEPEIVSEAWHYCPPSDPITTRSSFFFHLPTVLLLTVADNDSVWTACLHEPFVSRRCSVQRRWGCSNSSALLVVVRTQAPRAAFIIDVIYMLLLSHTIAVDGTPSP